MITEAIKNPKYEKIEKVKLLIIYNLRYELENGNVAVQLATDLLHRGASPSLISAISGMTIYATEERRSGDRLFCPLLIIKED